MRFSNGSVEYISSLAVLLPVEVGLKRIFMVPVFPGVIGAEVHVSLPLKNWSASVPLKLIELTTRFPGPALDTVKVNKSEVEPMTPSPKSWLVGSSPISGSAISVTKAS